MAIFGSPRKYYSTSFGAVGPSQQDDGTITSGTAGETNRLMLGDIPWTQFVIGTQTTVVPAENAAGINIVQTDTNGQGMALSPFGNSCASPLSFIIGTDPAFFAEFVVQVTDWSGCQLMFGFHGGAAGTMQAHQATWANYTDKAAIGNYAGGAVDVYTSTALNNAADVDTDTTINLTDGDVAKFRVNVSAAGVVTYSLAIAPTATPTTFTTQTLTTAAYTFDSTDNVTPFIYLINHTDTASAVILQKFSCGYQ